MRRIAFLSLVLIFSLLALLALIFGYSTIDNDFNTITSYNYTFRNVVSLDLPAVINPIGFLGALSTKALLVMTGFFFSLAILVSVIILSFILLFNLNYSLVGTKITLFLILSFCTEALLFIYSISSPSFLFTIIIGNLFIKLLSETGTVIMFSISVLLCIIALLGIERIRAILSDTFVFLHSKKDIKKNQKAIIQDIYPDKDGNNLIQKPTDSQIVPEITNFPIKDSNNELPKNVDLKSFNKKKSVSRETDAKVYQLPNIDDFFHSFKVLDEQDKKVLESEIKKTSSILIEKLFEFGIEAVVKKVNIGPVITQYEIEPSPGVKVSKFLSYTDDLALALKAKSIRIQAPIPGIGRVGIEIPNRKMDIIYLKDILTSNEAVNSDSKLLFALGKDITGNPVLTELDKMPHLLIAGATGSGKSVCVNTIINSLLLRTTPDELRLVLIDPKRIELSGYSDIPHLIQDVVTDPEDALIVLNWAVSEMERRYELLQQVNCRDLAAYNKKASHTTDNSLEVLPLIVIIVDEFADLIMTAGRDIEIPITRLAQMARAIGIHLILATQRPSTKVITGIIKANFPSRIAFRVSSKIDSRVILDANGAESLLGRGDMLFLPPGKPTPQRIHGAYLEDSEIEHFVEYLRSQPKPLKEIIILGSEKKDIGDFQFDDDLFPSAAVFVVTSNTASVSMLQRHFKIGYARAGRLVDLLEQAGIVGPHLGSKPREVLCSEEELKQYGYLD